MGGKKRFGRDALEKYLRLLEGIDEVDIARVRRIKRMIEEGRYEVDSRAVAEKMLEDMFDEESSGKRSRN